MKQQAKVQLLDTYGRPSGEKDREAVNKMIDIVHVIHVVLRFGNTVYLSKIPRNEKLPNIWVGKLGTPIATMLRMGENPDQAVGRCLVAETNLNEIHTANFIHSSFENLDGVKRLLSVFVYDLRQKLKPEDLVESDGIRAYTQGALEAELKANPDAFAPSFRAIWERAGKALFS